MSADRGDVRLEIDGSVAYVTLDRPASRNALSTEMDVALGEAFARADSDDSVHAIVLRSSSPDWFCAGGDVHEVAEGRVWGVGRGGGLTGIDGPRRDLRTPLIAQVTGPAVGIGVELALCSDIIVASDTAWFSVPEATIGLVGGPGVMHRLLRQLPQRVATAMILTGARLSAEDALRFGLVNEIAPISLIDAATRRWLDPIIGASPVALRAVLEAIRVGSQLRLDDALTARYPLTESFSTTEDFQEARSAVADRRRPLWKGR
ncbi:enoyl-CoA hydratase/isomerase family protein [Agromyces sp. Marseille-P2726]|uniref:enoyl-CoA hydratase/isomerase family protein n=1 Tax=Agromyces sp. Marseille-P2726 TaxID=2709132 RepID=UPI00156EF647|nr:enoyl-CoA hydratase-related protein [Agromyces sp. Marseille-P2726]